MKYGFGVKTDAAECGKVSVAVPDMANADRLSNAVAELRGICHVFNAVNDSYTSDVMPEYAYLESRLWAVLDELDRFNVRA